MKPSDQLQLTSQIINFIIFVYFAIILIQTNPLDIVNILISAVGLIISIIVNIISVLERTREI